MRGRLVPLLRAVGSLALLLALVVGVPALLIVTVGNPFPSALPTLDEIRVTLTQNGQGFSNFLISALALFIWFIWAQLIVALVVEIVATVRRRESRRLPTAPGIQALAARLVASITLATTLAAGPVMAPALGALDLDAFDPPAASAVIVEAGIGDEAGIGARIDAGHTTHAATADPNRSTPFDAGTITNDADSLTAHDAAAAVVVLADETELWDLAELAYGDGIAWKTVAAANAGALDGAGRSISSDTEVVAAGTALALPGSPDTEALAAVGSVQVEAPSEPGVVDDPVDVIEPDSESAPVDAGAIVWTPQGADAPDGVHVVEAGESMWTIAEAEVERRIGQQPTEQQVAEYWADVVDANQQVPSGDVDLIHPGDELTVPGAGAVELLDGEQPDGDLSTATDGSDVAVTSTSVQHDFDGVVDGPIDAASTSSGVRTVSARAAAAEVEPHAQTDSAVDGAVPASAGGEVDVTDGTASDDGSIAVPAALAAFGTATMAAGIIGALRRRRALQRRLREPGEMPRMPSTEAAAFEAALAHSADQVIESAQGNGWRMLPASAVAAVRSAGPMEVHASATGELVAVPLRDDLETAGAPGPGVDLHAAPSISDIADLLDLDPVAADRTAASADSTVAAAPTTVVIGTDPQSGSAVLLDLASSARVDLRGSGDDVRRLASGIVLDLCVSDRADDLCVIAVGLCHELADLERLQVVATMPDALVAAVHCGHAADDSSTPVVVVASADPPDHDAAIGALLELGAAVVAPGQPEAPSRVTVTGDQARIWPNGSTVQLAAPDAAGFRSVAELVDVTAVEATAPAATAGPIDEVIEIAAIEACTVAAGPVEVKVLGPVEVEGAGSFSSVKAVDVVTYLAFHRHGVDGDQIKTWVWPAFEPPTDKAFANVLSRARTALGTDAEGNPYLSRAGADRTYRLADDVTTDFDRFRAYVDQADRTDDPRLELEALTRALELIRGIPFTGGAASSFAWADNHVRAHVEFIVDEAVHRCADLALRLDDIGAARQAAFKGLEVVPGCEQCFRRRFLVAGADNNRAELRRAMSDLERTAAAELGEPEAVDTISGELLALYHELDQSLIAGSA